MCACVCNCVCAVWLQEWKPSVFSIFSTVSWCCLFCLFRRKQFSLSLQIMQKSVYYCGLTFLSCFFFYMGEYKWKREWRGNKCNCTILKLLYWQLKLNKRIINKLRSIWEASIAARLFFSVVVFMWPQGALIISVTSGLNETPSWQSSGHSWAINETFRMLFMNYLWLYVQVITAWHIQEYKWKTNGRTARH